MIEREGSNQEEIGIDNKKAKSRLRSSLKKALIIGGVLGAGVAIEEGMRNNTADAEASNDRSHQSEMANVPSPADAVDVEFVDPDKTEGGAGSDDESKDVDSGELSRDDMMKLAQQKIDEMKNKLGDSVSDRLMEQFEQHCFELVDAFDKAKEGMNSSNFREALDKFGAESEEILKGTNV